MIRLDEGRLRAVLAWIVIVLLAGPIGGALWLGFVQGDSPCILCWSQRTSMVLIALTGLFVVRYGPRPRYLGMAVLLAAFGMYMALRHSGLHLSRDIGQGFSAPIFGVHTYIWSFVVHFLVLAVIGGLLLLREDDAAQGARVPAAAGRFAMGLFMVVVAANAVQAFASTGPPPFIGQGDPVRLSLNPRHWVWSFEETEGALSLRGAWTVPPPDLAALDADPAHGPLAGLPALRVARWERVGLPLNGALTGLARDGVTGRFLAVTDRYGVYLLDSTLSRALHQVVLDPAFSIDLSPLAGAAFLGGDTLAVLATNKSYVLLLPDPAADAAAEWRHFRTSDGGVRELALGRFATVRARRQYARSLAYDPAARELITVSVPSPRQPRLVVSRFARSDFVLSSEFEPALAAGPRAAPTRSVTEYVVSGATVEGGMLWAISAAWSTLLAIDLGKGTVRAAWTVPGLARPVGLAARGNELLIAQADGRIAVVERPDWNPVAGPR